jgi:mono/diheme cytochrome c family protein
MIRRLLPAVLVLALWTPAFAGTPAELLAGLVADAARDGAPVTPSASRGEAFFKTLRAEWSCSSCHTSDPRQQGRHAVTGKSIRPMAPAAEPARLTDRNKTDKWFRRNCHDVVGRPCTLAEQADVVAYLMSLK